MIMPRNGIFGRGSRNEGKGIKLLNRRNRCRASYIYVYADPWVAYLYHSFTHSSVLRVSVVCFGEKNKPMELGVTDGFKIMFCSSPSPLIAPITAATASNDTAQL